MHKIIFVSISDVPFMVKGHLWFVVLVCVALLVLSLRLECFMWDSSSGYGSPKGISSVGRRTWRKWADCIPCMQTQVPAIHQRRLVIRPCPNVRLLSSQFSAGIPREKVILCLWCRIWVFIRRILTMGFVAFSHIFRQSYKCSQFRHSL